MSQLNEYDYPAQLMTFDTPIQVAENSYIVRTNGAFAKPAFLSPNTQARNNVVSPHPFMNSNRPFYRHQSEQLPQYNKLYDIDSSQHFGSGYTKAEVEEEETASQFPFTFVPDEEPTEQILFTKDLVKPNFTSTNTDSKAHAYPTLDRHVFKFEPETAENRRSLSQSSESDSKYTLSSNSLKRKTSSDSEYSGVDDEENSSTPRRTRERGTKQPRYLDIENQVLVESQFMLWFQDLFHGHKYTEERLKNLHYKRLEILEPTTKFTPRDGSALTRHYKSLKRTEKDLWKFVDTKTEFGMHLSAIEELVKKQLASVSNNNNNNVSSTSNFI